MAGKENSADNKKDKAEKAEVKKKGKKKDDNSSDTPAGRFAKLRPQRRLIFFIVFLCFNVWVLAMHDPCNSKLIKKKEDCGWSGISATMCKVGACFLKGGGDIVSKKITLKREKDTKFGIKIDAVNVKTSGLLEILGIEEGGAVAAHNARVPPDDRIRVGDKISKFDGETGTQMTKALKSSEAKDYKLTVKRSALPAALGWIRHLPAASRLEMVLTTPGFQQWSRWFMKIGGPGFFCWFLSGYPLASVPMYLTIAAATGFGVSRCCYNDQVKSGPHCYKSMPAEVETLIPDLVQDTVALGKKVAAEPRKYVSFLWTWTKDFDFLWKGK